MDRREFMKGSLLTMGASLAAARTRRGAVDLEGENGLPQRPQGKLKVQYIRPDIPHFEIPAYRGKRYDDSVPDTLDIAERAKWGINGLTSITDPDTDQEIYCVASFLRNPPAMMHKMSDWVRLCEGMMEALPLLRMATGSSLNAHVDPVWMQVLLKEIGPDGLVYIPMKGNPYIWVDIRPGVWPFGFYFDPVWKADGSTTKIDDPKLSQLATGEMCQRAIGTMTIYYLRDKDPMWKAAIEKMIQRLATLAVHTGDFAYLPRGAWEPNGRCGAGAEMATGRLGSDNGNGRVIQGLAQYYNVTGYEPALQLAGKFTNFMRYHAQNFDPGGLWLVGPDEKMLYSRWKLDRSLRGGHGHGHTIVLLSILEYAIAAGDHDLMQFVRTGYEWAKAANSSPLIGWFPTVFVPNFDGCENDQICRFACETCTLADMVAMALKLSRAGVGDYWDDADRWIRNHFAESQLTDAEWVHGLAEHAPRKPVAWNETADRVPERVIGTFADRSTGNEFGDLVVACCNGNGNRTLYYIWEHIIDHDRGKLRVNLLLNRASAWADIYSHIPYAGKVEIKVKKQLESVMVRMPEWLESRNPEIVTQTNGHRHEARWEGRYLSLGHGKPHDVIAVTFPMPQRRTKEAIGTIPYTLDIKGNTVVKVDPAGEKGQLYQRSQYLAQQAPVRKVERFVSDETIVW